MKKLTVYTDSGNFTLIKSKIKHMPSCLLCDVKNDVDECSNFHRYATSADNSCGGTLYWTKDGKIREEDKHPRRVLKTNKI
jgi:hypothetical protein